MTVRPLGTPQQPAFVLVSLLLAKSPARALGATLALNPAHVCAAHQSGSDQVTLVIDYGEAGGYQNVVGDLKSVWEKLTGDKAGI